MALTLFSFYYWGPFINSREESIISVPNFLLLSHDRTKNAYQTQVDLIFKSIIVEWKWSIFRSMLNCVNNLNLEPQSMNSGIERAALMVSEEKHQQDSRKKIHHQLIYHPFLMNFIISFEYQKSIIVEIFQLLKSENMSWICWSLAVSKHTVELWNLAVP